MKLCKDCAHFRVLNYSNAPRELIEGAAKCAAIKSPVDGRPDAFCAPARGKRGLCGPDAVMFVQAGQVVSVEQDAAAVADEISQQLPSIRLKVGIFYACCGAIGAFAGLALYGWLA